MTYMRIRYQKLGGHYHCRVFTSQMQNGTYAKCGELVFDEREWRDVTHLLERAELIDESREAA